jgi:SMC interacting uncharacterized protein involved in chromosome segregation
VKSSADEKEKVLAQYKTLIDQVEFIRGKIDKVVGDYEILINQKMQLQRHNFHDKGQDVEMKGA